MLYPLLWMLSASVRPEDEIFSSHLALAIVGGFQLLHPRLERAAISASARFFWNSLVVSVLTVIGNVMACSLAAFAFARLKFTGRNFWFAMMLGTLMMPYHVTLIPQYVLFLNLGWVDTYPAAGGAEVPRGRRLLHLPDGAVLPRHPARARRGGDDGRLLALADLLEDHAAAVAAGAGDGGDLLLHLDLGRFLRSADLPQRHEELHRSSSACAPSSTRPAESDWGGLFAMSTLSLVPVFFFFLFFQRLLIEGIATTGMKR